MNGVGTRALTNQVVVVQKVKAGRGECSVREQMNLASSVYLLSR